MNDKEFVEILDHVLSHLRHEIGNFLNSLRITLDVLEDGYEFFDNHKRLEYIKRAKRIVSEYGPLLDALKEYSKYHLTDHRIIQFQSFWENLSAYIYEILRDRQDVNIQMICDINDCNIIGDEALIQKSILNVINNSLEALDGIDNPQIRIGAERDGDYLKLTIYDNGTGIPPENRNRIFFPLFSTKPGHRGMGLPTAHRLITLMGGRIDIDTSMDKGTLVRIWIKADFNDDI